jgi:hypothetical protein
MYGDIMNTHTKVPINMKKAYIKRVDVDSFMAGKNEQQHLNADPHNRYFN